MAPRVLLSGTLRKEERALLEHWAARAVSGPAGKPHLSLGLSEEGEELAGSLGAATPLCASVALLTAASSLWVGTSTQAARFPVVLDCLWLCPQFRNCVSASPRSSAGGSVGKHGLWSLQAWDALYSRSALKNAVRLGGILRLGSGCSPWL